MLNASKLRNFLDAAQAAVPVITKNIPVLNDEDVSKDTREISANDGLILIGVLPSFKLDYKNEDNYKHNNMLMVFIVKKYDTKSGKDAMWELFDEAGAAVLKFEEYLFKEKSSFPCRKEIKLETLNADPVRDYFGLFGYMMQFELKN